MKNKVNQILSLAKAIDNDFRELSTPADKIKGLESHKIIPFSIVKGSRGYIERVVNQINGTFEQGWYDACAVMMRRLLETVIIETYEAHQIEAGIKDSDNNYFQLSKLISSILSEKRLNLSRNTKNALPKLKKFGDTSAHNIRFNARFDDIKTIQLDFRIAIEEFINLAKLADK